MTLQTDSLLMVQSNPAISNTQGKQKLVHYSEGFCYMQIKSKGNISHFNIAGIRYIP